MTEERPPESVLHYTAKSPALRALRAYSEAHADEAIEAVEEPKKSCRICWLDFPPAEVNQYDECISCYEQVRKEYGELPATTAAPS